MRSGLGSRCLCKFAPHHEGKNSPEAKYSSERKQERKHKRIASFDRAKCEKSRRKQGKQDCIPRMSFCDKWKRLLVSVHHRLQRSDFCLALRTTHHADIGIFRAFSACPFKAVFTRPDRVGLQMSEALHVFPPASVTNRICVNCAIC